MRIVLALALAAALSAAVSAQVGNVQRPTATFALAQLQKEGVPGDTRPVDPAQKYTIVETGATVGPTTKVREGMKVQNEKGEVFVVHVPDRFVSVGLYLASFGVAGPIQRNDGSFEGGTSNSNSSLVSLDVGLPFPKRYGTLGVGGWYFFSPGGDVDDVYQAHLRYGLRNNSPFGLQVAYLNARRPDSYGLTYHVTYTLSSARVAPSSNPWSVEFGAGLFNDVSRQPQIEGGARARSTLDTSFYVNTSWTILPRTSALATIWTIRDRNVDITRYCLGISYRF